jgi:hypothetical protein
MAAKGGLSAHPLQVELWTFWTGAAASSAFAGSQHDVTRGTAKGAGHRVDALQRETILQIFSKQVRHARPLCRSPQHRVPKSQSMRCYSFEYRQRSLSSTACTGRTARQASIVLWMCSTGIFARPAEEERPGKVCGGVFERHADAIKSDEHDKLSVCETVRWGLECMSWELTRPVIVA